MSDWISHAFLLESRPVGDAIAIELDDDVFAVALLATSSDGENPVGYGYNMLRALGINHGTSLRGLRTEVLAAKNEEAVLMVPEDAWPGFGIIGAQSDPADFLFLRPAQMSEVLGDGYHVERVTLKVTDRPVTREIENALPWVSSFKDRRPRPLVRVWPRGQFGLSPSVLRSE